MQDHVQSAGRSATSYNAFNDNFRVKIFFNDYCTRKMNKFQKFFLRIKFWSNFCYNSPKVSQKFLKLFQIFPLIYLKMIWKNFK